MPEHLEKQGGVFAVNEKKVIAVIVEGPSDEAALGSILKEYFSSAEIQFVVVHGDITTKDYTSTDNILSKINNLIESVKQKYGYKREDFFYILPEKSMVSAIESILILAIWSMCFSMN